MDNDPSVADLKSGLITIVEDGYHFDRVNIVSGEVSDETGIALVIDATRGYGTSGYQTKAAAEAIYDMATSQWGTEQFGAVLPEGTGGVGFVFTSDGTTYRLSPETMKAIYDHQMTAEQAMSLSVV